MARSFARRPSSPRAALAVLALLAPGLVALTAAPTLGAVSRAYPVQSLGDRGTDVAAIQRLIRYHERSAGSGGTGRTVVVRGMDPTFVPIDGVFGASTVAGVKAFQVAKGLSGTGVVEAATWSRLVVAIGPGSSGDAVLAAQRVLREKRAATVPLDGVFGAATTAAVKDFQAHMGLAATGSVDGATWQRLAWHYERPVFSTAGLCDYSVGNGPANWGTAEMIATIEAGGNAMVGAGYGRVAVGDVSHEHGGDIVGHESHEVGLDADLRLMRKANDQCSWGTRWTLSTYDRAATRALIKAIHSATPGHVKVIYFNDPVLISEGLTTHLAGHEDHLHVRLCEAGHPDARFRCG